MIQNQFTKKKIGPLTLGEKLKKIRSERRLSLGEISKATKIQVKYLEYLENEDFDSLPADVYVKGFLRSYANYLGVGEESLVRIYDREKKVIKNIQRGEKVPAFIKPISISKFVITPKTLLVSVAVILGLLGFIYLYREVNIFVSTPRLAVLEPFDGITTDDRMITVQGRTEKDAEVFINEQSVVVSEDGMFQEVVMLQQGVNTITVKARNKFEKEATVSVMINSTPSESGQADYVSDAGEEGASPKIKLKLRVLEPTKLVIKTDEAEAYNGVLLVGEERTFEGSQSVAISSDKGNKTIIVVDDGLETELDPKPGKVENKIFSVENN